MEQTIVSGLDSGTTKIACIICETDGTTEPKIIGVGVSPSEVTATSPRFRQSKIRSRPPVS